MNMLASEHDLHAKMFGSSGAPVTLVKALWSCAEGIVRANGAGDRVVQCRGNSFAGAA